MSLQAYDGNEWVTPVVRLWNGAAYLRGTPLKRWDGSEWVAGMEQDTTTSIDPYTTWAGYPAAEFDDGLYVPGPARYLTPIPGSGDDPVFNPAVNLTQYIQPNGPLEMDVMLKLEPTYDSYLILHGTPPIIQDEWRMSVNTLQLEFVSGTLWWSYYDHEGTYTGTFVDMDFGELTRIHLSQSGNTMGLWVNGQEIFNRTFPDNIFASNKIYLSVADDSASGGFRILAMDLPEAAETVDLVAGYVEPGTDSLRVNAANYYPNVTVGTAIAPIPLYTDTKYRNVLGREFSQVTPENAMKFQFVQPSEGRFTFEDVDRILDFCKLNNMTFHGHALTWEEAVPQWLLGGGFTNQQIQDILVNHIDTVMRRYRGRIRSCDIINEPFEGFTADLRNSIWFQAMGRDYVKIALQAAAAADPSALLFINEWGCEEAGTKQDALYDLVVELQAEGVPIHGVGLQMHEDMNADYQSTWPPNTASVDGPTLLSAIQRFKSLGIHVRISEFDVNLHQIYSDTIQAQAEYFREILHASLQGGVLDFCMWGFTDKYSSLQEWYDWDGYGNGLIFDPSIEPKSAYYALNTRLKNEPFDVPLENVTRPNLMVFPYLTDNSDWMDVSAGVNKEYFQPNEFDQPLATKVTFSQDTNHHQWRDLPDKLVPGHQHRLTTWVNKNTPEGFSGQFQHAYYDVSTNLIGTTHSLSGTDWEQLTYEFTAPDATNGDPSIRILGWGEGSTGEAIVIGAVELVDLDMEYTSAEQPAGTAVPAGSEASHPLARPKAFYLQTPQLRGASKAWEGIPSSEDTSAVLENDFGCDPAGSGNWDWYATEIRPASEGPFGERFFRTYVDQGMYVSSDTQGDTLRRGTGWENEILSATRAYLQYQVRFPADFDFVKGGKLPGLTGGDSPSGGSPADNGFSCRMMWRAEGQGELYLYAMNTEETLLKSVARSSLNFRPGQWHTVAQEIILNDPGMDNGVARIWFDGRPVFEQHGIIYRDDPAITIDGIMATIFFGGGDQSWAASKDEHIDHGNYVIYTE